MPAPPPLCLTVPAITTASTVRQVPDQDVWTSAGTLGQQLADHGQRHLNSAAQGEPIAAFEFADLAPATVPSVALFPALLPFGLTENAITFVIVLGAAPSIANGIISGIDEVPPDLLRAGHMLDARGVNRYR